MSDRGAATRGLLRRRWNRPTWFRLSLVNASCSTACSPHAIDNTSLEGGNAVRAVLLAEIDPPTMHLFASFQLAKILPSPFPGRGPGTPVPLSLS